MAFKDIANLDADTTISLGGFNKKLRKDNPTSIEGYYIGNKQVDSAMSKTGKSFLYIFQTPTGNVGVWGKTDLDKKMRQAALGQMTRVQFAGEQPIPGKNPMYVFKVAQDASNAIDVTGADEQTSPNLFDENYEEPGINDEFDHAPAPSVAVRGATTLTGTPVRTQSTKVQELLNKAKANRA